MVGYLFGADDEGGLTGLVGYPQPRVHGALGVVVAELPPVYRHVSNLDTRCCRADAR